jgi:hypothetical protein
MCLLIWIIGSTFGDMGHFRADVEEIPTCSLVQLAEKIVVMVVMLGLRKYRIMCRKQSVRMSVIVA